MEHPAPRNLKERQRVETERRILDTAADIFAEVGFSGARIDLIADRADVNKATIYYHIGNKEALYARVLHDVFGGSAAAIAGNVARANTPEGKLKAYVRSVIRAVNDNPHVAPMMMREMAAGGQNLPEIAVKDLAQMFSTLMDILQEGVEKGVFANTSPPLVHFMTVGAVIFSRNMQMVQTRYTSLPETRRLNDLFPSNTPAEIEKLVLRAVRRP